MVDCEGISLGSSCAKLPHSHSAEISKTPPPGGPKNPGKMLALRVHMLDDNVTLFQVQAKALGRVLFEQVCKQLNLLEADYFGLEYQDHNGTRYWLDVEKPLSRQVGLSLVEPLLHFCVKFYTPDPAQLEEEYTRYLFCLQIKRDLAQGHIQCNDNTAALMASYIVQAECGDYMAEDYPDASYLSSYKFVQHQDRELEKKIMENHKKHAGQSPAEADLNLLETARRCELYGMKMHSVKDHEGVPLNLAVAHMGIVVFQGYTKIYTFSWAKIRKISFKRKKFLIKLHPDGYGYYKDTVEFFFETRNECKNLWKKCVENHGFFRCNAVKRAPRQRTRVLSRGSSFRYSGKTQKQMVEFVRENYVKRQNFQRNHPLSRSQSFRQSSSVHSSVATNVGGSISAHPLIPLGDTSIVSASCGSMVLAGVEGDSPSRTSPVMAGVGADRTRTTLLNHSSPPLISPRHLITSPPAGLHISYKQYITTSSQTDIVDFVEQIEAEPESHTPIFTWHRSASCKELRKTQESIEIETKPPQPKYERNFIIAGSKTPSLDRTGVEPDGKVYSSSYPGTTSSLSTESADEIEPGGSVLVMDTGSSREFSQDDLSHDSYELLEREARSFIHSRSCSLGSSGEVLPDDEMFVIDDYKEDVEKRLGYVEPRYRDMGFNEFNEKCKMGFAKFRERERIDFNEFDSKDDAERYPVERTNSEPFVSDFWKVARQHRKLFHQKSFDYTPTDSIDTEERSQTSKSTADIPYTLHKRQQMNGTAPCYECRSPVSPRKSPEKRVNVELERKRSTKSRSKLTKTKQDSDLNSQDSGLSLSLGTESVDDLIDQNAKNDVLTIKSTSKSNEEVSKIPRITNVKKDLLKVTRSEDGPRMKGVLVKTKAFSADSDFRKTPSFERNPPVEVIKIDSQDGEGIVICSSDDKNISIDSSDPDVIIVEYKTSRRRAFQKRGSSDSRSSMEKKVSSSFDSQKSDSDAAGPRKGKMKEWKSESSSSQDIQDRSDFRRERFSKEIKTSIEGKVVRESKEEKELKKQRSEEMERQKTQKLIKSKSASTERNPDRSPTKKDAKAEFEKTKANLIELKSVGYCTCDHDISKMTSKQSDKKVMDALVENKEEAEEVFENQIQKRTAPLEINVEIKNKNTNNVKENGKVITNQVTPVQHSAMESCTLSSKSTVGSIKDAESDINEDDRSDDVFLEEREFKAANLLSNRNRGGVREIIIIDTEEEHKKIVGRKKKRSNEDVEICKKQELSVVVDLSKTDENMKFKESEISKNPQLSKIDVGKKDEIERKHELPMVEVHKIDSGTSKMQVLPEVGNSEVNDILEIKGSEISKKQEPSSKNGKKDERLKTMPVEVAEEAVEVEELNQKEFVSSKNKKPNELTLKRETCENKPVSKVEELDSATKTNKQDVAKQVTSPELVWKKFGELPPLVNKRERSPVLFARLGFSEGSAFSPTHAQSPASSRRAKSLDAPVVSLHRLPPITSFSSKDDTVDNDEGIELEEKSLRGIKPVGKTSVIEEEDASHLSPITREMPSSELTAVTPEPGDKQKSIPSPIVVDKVPTESVNTDDDTKSSPCTVAEISPDYNKSPQEKGPSCDTSEADQALPVAKKLHSRLLVDVDKLSNASDEQKVPESDVYDFDSPRKPSEAYDDDYENDVFECIASDKEVERIVSRDPMERRVLSAEQSPVRGPSPTPDNTIRKASLEVPGKRSSTSDSRKASDSSDILEGEGPEPLTERRPSTRQERLDSFKNTKSYSVEIWTSEETDAPGIPTVDIEDVDWGNDDDAFAPDPIEVLKDHMSPKEAISPDTISQEKLYFKYDEPTIESNISGDEVFLECEKPICQISVTSYIDDKVEIVESPDIYSTPIEETQPLADLGEKVEDPSTIDLKMIPPKRSFDEDVSSSSSVKPERGTWKPFSLESSGSSSLEEGIFPPDDCSHFADEEEGSSNSAKEDYQGFGYSVVGAETLIGGYTGGVFGLSRTLSRISERSTTSEQERSDFEDDISTKPSSRSLSVEDESLMSSDRQPSLSSDPSINPEIEDRPLPPLPPEPLGFKIPPPLLNPEDEWPSPPNSSFETPVISNVEAYYMEMKPEEATKVVIPRETRQYESSSDSDYENKTLQDDAPESSAIESTVKLAVKPKRPGNSSDTSLGVSDFSSSTSTVKLQYYSCTVKSDDSSLAEFGSSLSTEMLVSSRKNSDDSVCLRRRSYHALQRSFDDYDSPYSESDESSRQQRQRGYMNLPSPTSGGSGSQTPRKGTKQQEGRRKEERRPGGGKSIARSKCYSYYSLARSPPSDGSSSSLEMGEPPTTPNTIPRVSKRKRHVPPSKRRLRVSTELDIRDGHLISVSSPSVVACVAVVDIEDNKLGSPQPSQKLFNKTPNHSKSNNSINVITSTPKVNGGPLPHNSSELNSPELSPMKTLKDQGPGSADTLDGEVKKKRYSTDRAYFIAKEILMTERTYRKDLEVINLWLRDEFDKELGSSIPELLQLIDPLHDAHCAFLKDMELRLSAWESRGVNHHRVADLLIAATNYLPLYEDYLQDHLGVLVRLAKDLCNDAFEQIYTSFEKNKICYLPLTLFILKPIQRLLHYSQLIERLMKHYGNEHPDYTDCELAANKFTETIKNVPEILHESENYVQLIELGRDLSGFDGTLTEGDRQFIRQGCLAKFSQRKGFQQRMFFLLSDVVLYTNLVGQSFRVHGQMPVKSLTVQEREDNPTPNSFIIYSGNRAITVSANSQEEKDKWLEDLTVAIDKAKNSSNNTSLLSLKCTSSLDDVTEKSGEDGVVRASPQRSNTTVHVCWHRNTSISLHDQLRAAQNQLSGYLLRKFKNSNGWQKLWVVFTNFCLFFYKTYQDDAPLASLPLLGYSVTTPTEKDNINKDFVFKLQFKNHVYFFRAESDYTFSRWMEVIGSATQHSGRIRLFSRKESSFENIV